MLDEEEHFKELLYERLRNYGERNKEQDFWLVIEPKFLDIFPNITKRLCRPAVALVSTYATWITSTGYGTDGRGENSFSNNSGSCFSNIPTDSFKEDDDIPMFRNDLHEAEDSHVHDTDGITENGDLKTIDGMLECIDQYDPRAMTEENDQHSSRYSRRKWNLPISVLFRDARNVLRRDELGQELLLIAFPAVLTLIANAITSWIQKAFIRRLGQVELAAAENSISVFNQAVNVLTFTLASITASFVADEISLEKICADSAKGESTKMKMLMHDIERLDSLERGSETSLPAEDHTASLHSKERQHIPSAFTAVVVAGILGIMLTVSLSFGAETLLAFVGITYGSPGFTSARRSLKFRSIGAPAILLYFAVQGVFQGFKDTRTPLYATVAGKLANIALDVMLMFVWQLGSSGAAISYTISQYLTLFILLWRMMREVNLLPPSFKDMRFRQFLKNGTFMFARGVVLAFFSAVAAMLAGRLGSTPSAAFLICIKVWSTSSLIAGGLAIAGQAIVAGAFAEKNYDKVIATASRVVQMGVVLGLGLAFIVAVGLKFGVGAFSEDVDIQRLIFVCIPFAAATQPINSLAFVCDGINFGASDFFYSSYSTILVTIIGIALLFLFSMNNTLSGIWVALTVYMVLRTIACIWRMATGTGPWCFLNL